MEDTSATVFTPVVYKTSFLSLPRCPETLFEVEWLDDGSIVIKANNNSYIYNKPTGSLTAGSDSATDKEKFRVKIVNRPILVLRSDFGFVGAKSPGAAKADVVCNRTTYEVIYVESASTGAYLLKGENPLKFV